MKKYKLTLPFSLICCNFFFLSRLNCSCTSRYVGTFCEHLNPCHTSSGPRCQNGGVCEVDYTSAVPSFKCRCPIGFTASLCEITERNACDSGPCQNGGSCHLKSLQDYHCSCAQGYTGKTKMLFFIKKILPQFRPQAHGCLRSEFAVSKSQNRHTVTEY